MKYSLWPPNQLLKTTKSNVLGLKSEAYYFWFINSVKYWNEEDKNVSYSLLLLLPVIVRNVKSRESFPSQLNKLLKMHVLDVMLKLVLFLCRSRSRLADFHMNCQMTPHTVTSCPHDNYHGCLMSYVGLIGKSNNQLFYTCRYLWRC